MLTLEVHSRRYRNIQLLLSLIHWLYFDVDGVRLNNVCHGTVTHSYCRWLGWLFLVMSSYDINESFLDVQPHIDVMASLLFVNINGIPVMYAVFKDVFQIEGLMMTL